MYLNTTIFGRTVDKLADSLL